MNEKTVKQKLWEKLTSRKFWAAMLAAGFSAVFVLLGDRLGAQETQALHCGVNALIAYVFGEGVVDLARIVSDSFGKTE